MSEISLKDIQNNNKNEENLKEVDITKVLPAKKPEHTRADNQQSLSNDIDKAIERTKKLYIKENLEENAKIEEELREKEIDGEIDGVDKEYSDYVMSIVGEDQDQPSNESTDKDEDEFEKELSNSIEEIEVDMEEQSASISEETNRMTDNSKDISETSDLGDRIDDSDFDDLEIEKQLSNEAEIKEFTTTLADKINPIKNSINLAGIKVSKKPAAISNALLEYTKNKHISDWVMYADSKNFSMEAFTGTEIDDIDARNYGQRNRFNTYMQIYTNIFNHIVGLKNKTNVNAWLKSTNFFSMNDIWFNIYKSSFEKANIVPYDCPHCKASFVREVPIMDMVKFKDDTVKEKFQKLFDSTEVFTDGSYDTLRIPISDKIAVDLREPSIWNVIFENAILDDTFRQKYARLLTTITYIDAMYLIKYDRSGQVAELQEIKPPEYPNNMLKEIKHRVYTYAKIIQTLSSDEKAIISSFINSIITKHDSITYVVPETTCEKCGKVIKEQDKTGEELLFTRQDLADIANFSHK